MGYSSADRIAAYEEMWHKEESESWNWLEQRVRLEVLALRDEPGNGKSTGAKQDAKVKLQQRRRILSGKDVQAKLNEERMSEREMADAVRVTQERLHVLQDVVENRKGKQGVGGASQAA